MEWKKIFKVPETQLAGIMLSMDTVPKVFYLKCDKCVDESKDSKRMTVPRISFSRSCGCNLYYR